MSFGIRTGLGSATPGQRVYRYKSPIHGKVTEFYAEQGLISIHGEGPDGQEEYIRVNLREFLLRAEALSLEARRPGKYPRERKAILDLIDVMLLAARACKEQGDPFNDRDMEQMIATRLPSRVSLTGQVVEPAAYLPGVPAVDPSAPIRTLDPSQDSGVPS